MMFITVVLKVISVLSHSVISFLYFCRSVPETTFDLHGDLHSVVSLATSKVCVCTCVLFGVSTCVCVLLWWFHVSNTVCVCVWFQSSGKLDMDRPGNMGERGMVKPMIRTEPGFTKHDGRWEFCCSAFTQCRGGGGEQEHTQSHSAGVCVCRLSVQKKCVCVV